MNRCAVTVILAVGLAAAPAVAQVPEAPRPVPAPQSPAAAPAVPDPIFIERESAQETRGRLHELLRQHPPAVGEILRRDPSLARPDYLAPYPALLGFIQQHPEITRNPSFFFGEYEFQDDQPQDRSFEMFRRVTDIFQF